MPTIQLPQRPQPDYAQLGGLVGQAISPMAGIQEKLLPLLMMEQFKHGLAQRRSEAFLDRIERQGLKGKFSFGAEGGLKGFTPFTKKELVGEAEAGETLERRATPVSPVEGFKYVKPGFLGRFGITPQARAEGVVPENPRVKNIIDQIKSQADIDEFMERIGEAKKSGWTLDMVNSVLEAFGKSKMVSF